jgi:hypothetical protein
MGRVLLKIYPRKRCVEHYAKYCRSSQSDQGSTPHGKGNNNRRNGNNRAHVRQVNFSDDYDECRTWKVAAKRVIKRIFSPLPYITIFLCKFFPDTSQVMCTRPAIRSVPSVFSYLSVLRPKPILAEPCTRDQRV